MDKTAGRLVYTGDIVKRGGARYDVVIADENIFVVCRRTKYNGRETGVTSYRMPEIYSNDPRMGSLAAYQFELDGTWLDPVAPLGKATARQRAADEKAARAAVVDPEPEPEQGSADDLTRYVNGAGETKQEEQKEE